MELKSLASGVIWIGELPYGTYYLKETTAPTASGYGGNVDKWFCLIVDEAGVFISANGHNSGADDAANKELALRDAEAVRSAATSAP